MRRDARTLAPCEDRTHTNVLRNAYGVERRGLVDRRASFSVAGVALNAQSCSFSHVNTLAQPGQQVLPVPMEPGNLIVDTANMYASWRYAGVRDVAPRATLPGSGARRNSYSPHSVLQLADTIGSTCWATATPPRNSMHTFTPQDSGSAKVPSSKHSPTQLTNAQHALSATAEHASATAASAAQMHSAHACGIEASTALAAHWPAEEESGVPPAPLLGVAPSLPTAALAVPDMPPLAVGLVPSVLPSSPQPSEGSMIPSETASAYFHICFVIRFTSISNTCPTGRP